MLYAVFWCMAALMPGRMECHPQGPGLTFDSPEPCKEAAMRLSETDAAKAHRDLGAYRCFGRVTWEEVR